MADSDHKYKTILVILIVLFFIYLVLTLSRCSVQSLETSTIQVPTGTVELKNLSRENCGEFEFQYTSGWNGWNDQKGNVISPRFVLTNLEDKAGDFMIDFAFYDQAVFPYRDFQGKTFDEADIPWEQAAMTVDNVIVTIEPGEPRQISPEIEKKDPSATYWVYSWVTPPTYTGCSIATEQVLTNGSTVIERTITSNKTIKVTLLDYLLKNY